jgi:hypothetical protein
VIERVYLRKEIEDKNFSFRWRNGEGGEGDPPPPSWKEREKEGNREEKGIRVGPRCDAAV